MPLIIGTYFYNKFLPAHEEKVVLSKPFSDPLGDQFVELLSSLQRALVQCVNYDEAPLVLIQYLEECGSEKVIVGFCSTVIATLVE
jgi:hypothetical protein